jgi:hypothetical protein
VTDGDPGDDVIRWFDPEIAGLRVEADGGNAAIGSLFGSREIFRGTLTGRRLDQGDPVWRWLQIGSLTEKPDSFEGDEVWCEESYVYYLDERHRLRK